MTHNNGKKCRNLSCPYMCKYGFCGIDEEGCEFELLYERKGELHPSAYVRSNTIIEKDVEIAEMACIGSRGMTLQRGNSFGMDGRGHIHWRRRGSDFPVILKKGVYVGARTVIMRGSKWNTVIDEGTFIGPNCSIGHDNKIGKHCLILSGTVTCGSVFIGDYSFIAPSCTIKNRVKIGKNVKVGIGSLVLKDVPNGVTVVGRPAKEIELFRKERQKIKELFGFE